MDFLKNNYSQDLAVSIAFFPFNFCFTTVQELRDLKQLNGYILIIFAVGL